MDERASRPCCQFADDEALEHEAELFECETCPVAAHLDGMDLENRRAWDLTHLLCSRLMADTHGAGPLLVALTSDLDPEERADLLRRMTLIYDTLVPPPK